MVQLFDNSFKDQFEDAMTAVYVLDNCVDKEKRQEFFKSVLPHTIMEEKLEKLVELNKSVQAEAVKEDKKEIKTLSKSFDENFAAAGLK